MSAPQTTLRTALCVVIYHLALPRSMIVAIEQITWSQLHWLKLLHASYIFLLRQAGKGRVFYSADNRFETGADPRNVFDKQILKVWKPCLSAFYCVIPRATLVWSLKACDIARFSNQRARGQQTIGSHLKLFLDIVPRSSEDITRAMRGRPKLPSRIIWEKWRERHFIYFGFVSYLRCFLHSRPPFCAVGHFVCFSVRLAVHYFAVNSVLGS